jgi:hypothetical protein
MFRKEGVWDGAVCVSWCVGWSGVCQLVFGMERCVSVGVWDGAVCQLVFGMERCVSVGVWEGAVCVSWCVGWSGVCQLVFGKERCVSVALRCQHTSATNTQHNVHNTS